MLEIGRKLEGQRDQCCDSRVIAHNQRSASILKLVVYTFFLMRLTFQAYF